MVPLLTGLPPLSNTNRKTTVVSVNAGPALEIGAPKKLFSGDFQVSVCCGRSYDVSRDGLRFVMVKNPEGSLRRLKVVTNWFDEVRRRVAAAGQN